MSPGMTDFINFAFTIFESIGQQWPEKVRSIFDGTYKQNSHHQYQVMTVTKYI